MFRAFGPETFLSQCGRYHLAPLPNGWVVQIARPRGRPELHVEPDLYSAMRWCQWREDFINAPAGVAA